MPPTTCKALLKDYCENCTFAGVHFVADDTKHWFERWFWLAMVILSWYGSAVLIIAAWDAFIESPISFGLETTYTQWHTELPSVAVCEASNDDKLFSVCDTIWPPDHLLDLEDALREIAYFRGISYSLTEVCAVEKPDPDCMLSNYSYYANLIRSECSAILTNCSYNDEPFDCCEYFQPIDTDVGPCYIINSIQTEKPKPYPMVSNMRNKRSSIKFDVLLQSAMYTLGSDEVPSITTLQSSIMKIQLGHRYRLRSKKEKKKAYVEMFLSYLPTERFKRNVVRSRLDLVVSVGGTTGLFVGASLLSFVELIVYFTIRFCINIWLEQRASRTNVFVLPQDTEVLELDVREEYQYDNDQRPYTTSGVPQSQVEYDKIVFAME